MANTPVTKIIGTTGASGGAAFQTMVTTQNAAIVTAVTAAQAVTGVAPNSITVSPATLAVDSVSSIFELYQTVSYVVVS